jgi:hypothetical protein
MTLDASENRLGGNDGADGQNEHIAPAVEPQAPARTLTDRLSHL